MLPLKLTSSQTSDLTLFLLIKQSNVKAFEEVYNRYWPALVNAAYKRLHEREKAEDIAQAIFIDLYNRRLTIELTTSLKAYLFQALKFKVLNAYRSDLCKAKYQKRYFLNADCKIDFADLLEAKELETKIHSLLNRLPGRCKQVFLLSRMENRSNRDISVGLNITVSTVEKHITKALKSIRCHI